MESHGFVWPDGLPNCITCGRMPNDPLHVTPARAARGLFGITRVVAAASQPGRHTPAAAHAYTLAAPVDRIPCAVCRGHLGDSNHLVGAPAGVRGPSSIIALPEPPTLAHEDPPVVVEGATKLVLATKTASVVDVQSEMAEHFREVARGAGPHLWISGRYVGADEANRNGAFWSTADLQMGEPTVANGPVNWLHEERHIIGAIAGSKLVDRETAAASGLGAHIVALGAVWPWIYPEEAKVIQQASEAGSLWFSMECVSREVACTTEDCGKSLPYREYVTEKASRCEHMATGRRYVDPIFEGVGIIVPPVRPGWADSDARVTMQQAEGLVEREAASFVGLSDEDSVAVASRLLESAS
jgi:hypothetical protein